MKLIKKSIILLLALYMPRHMFGADHQSSDDFKIILEPCWLDLDVSTIEKQATSQEKWIAVGIITFKKRSKDHATLSHLNLYWQGNYMYNLFGSLYRLPYEKDFVPIEDYLVCDGTWNRAQQLLKLPFPKKQTLGPTNSYCLVLTIPAYLEPLLRGGRFSLAENSIPEQFRETVDKTQLSLNLDILDTTVEKKALHHCITMPRSKAAASTNSR